MDKLFQLLNITHQNSQHFDNLSSVDKTDPVLRVQLRRKHEQELKDRKVVVTKNDFYCKLCLENIKKEDGLQLKNCLHEFCKECLRSYINYQTDGYIICPYKDDKDDCDNFLKDYEIEHILSKDEFEKVKIKCLRQIEAQLSKPYHCKTLDCIGFCSLEDESLKFFHCPMCTEVNCIKCDAIHKEKTCFEYQCELKGDTKQLERIAAEKQALQSLIDEGEIMKCPKCNILLQKRDGQCQYIRCFFCKMDICWLTRGPRWGPNGKGDTSGGCKCGVNGKRCHPQCTNCH